MSGQLLKLPAYTFQTPTDPGNDFDNWVNTEPVVGWLAPSASWAGKLLRSTNYRRLPILYHDGWNAGTMTPFAMPNTPDDDAQIFFGNPFPNYPGSHWGQKGTLIRWPNCLVISENLGTTGFVGNTGTLAMLTALQSQLAAKNVGLFRNNDFDRYLTAHLPIDSSTGPPRTRTIGLTPTAFVGGHVLVIAGFIVGAGAIQFLNYVHVDTPNGLDTNYPMMVTHAAQVAATLPRFQSFQMAQVLGYDDPALDVNAAARWATFQGEIPTIQDALNTVNGTLIPIINTDDPAPTLTDVILNWLATLP